MTATENIENLRGRLMAAIHKVADPFTNISNILSADGESMVDIGQTWTIIEFHVRGEQSSVEYVADRCHKYLGKIDWLYDLDDGALPFTELSLIENIVHGIGDSVARVIQPLNSLHTRLSVARYKLVDGIQRPLVWTTDPNVYDNPDSVRRHSGMRVILADRSYGQPINIIGEQAAMAAVATGANDEASIERQLQKATGDTNMSMAANVDPAQARTATGARIMALANDTLVRDYMNQVNLGLAQDAAMIYMLNGSELDRPLVFDGRPYQRGGMPDGQQPPQDMDEVVPADFDGDMVLTPQANSTLADDDESKLKLAETVAGIFMGNPTVNQLTLRDFILTALGHGAELSKWAAPPPPPPPPPPMPENKLSVSVSMRSEDLSPYARGMVESVVVSMLSQDPRVTVTAEGAMDAPPIPPPGMDVGPGGPPMPPPDIAAMLGGMIPPDAPVDTMAPGPVTQLPPGLALSGEFEG
jgi:hypothetical protein